LAIVLDPCTSTLLLLLLLQQPQKAATESSFTLLKVGESHDAALGSWLRTTVFAAGNVEAWALV
jgi:hypothetical protein